MRFYMYRELSPEEKKLPLAKYYDNYPLYPLPPLQRQILNGGPMNPADVIPAENWLDALMPTGYPKIIFGYCVMPDGSGFCTEYYTTSASITDEMMEWYMEFINRRSKNMPPNQGNLRYKIWCPVDNWDHGYVNGVNSEDGCWSIGAQDLGKSNPWTHRMEFKNRVNLREYGLTKKREAALRKAGCKWSATWEDFDDPGHHLWIKLTRPLPQGGTEILRYEWIGYYAGNGMIIRDRDTEVSETYLKDLLAHNTVMHLHLQQFLPDLYAEYSGKPMDAD